MQSSGEEWWRQQLELQRERVLVQEKLEGRWGMNAVADYEALSAFNRAGEGGRRYSGGETIDDEWSSLIFPFQGEEIMKGQHPFRKEKRAHEAALISRVEGWPEMQQCGSMRRRLAAGVGQRLDWPEVEDNQSAQLGWKAVWARYYCGDQIGCQNRMGWEREIFEPKENFGEEFGVL
jgi:hypothetical protein